MKFSASTAAAKYPCTRCCGKGFIQAYSHVAGGVCYRCGGDGVDPAKRDTAEAERLEAVRLEKVAKAAKAKREAEFSARFEEVYVAPEDPTDFLAILQATDAASDAVIAEHGDIK